MIPSRWSQRLSVAALCAALGACAHGGGPGAADPLPTDQPLAGRPRLYADCVTDAVRARAIMRFGSYLRYRCTGAPAKALFDEAESFSRARSLEFVADGKTTRRFSKTVWDDQCWRDEEGAAASYGCLTTQPMNRDFVSGRDVPEAKGK